MLADAFTVSFIYFFFELSFAYLQFKETHDLFDKAKASWIFSFFFWAKWQDLVLLKEVCLVHLQPTCGKVNRPMENIVTSIQPVVASLRVLQLCGKQTHLKKLVGFQNTRMGKIFQLFQASVSSDWRHHLKSVWDFFLVCQSRHLLLEIFRKKDTKIQMSHWKSKPKVWSWRHATVPDVVKRWVNEIQVP